MTADILKTEVDATFIDGMRDRMVVSFYKYGPVAEGAHKMDAIASLMARLRLYANGDAAKGIKPGNTEYLMDAANFAMIEFMYPKHPEAHFKGTDDDGSPGRVSARTGKLDKRDNREIGRNESAPRSALADFR
jgi:hypothetical protein